MLDDMSDFILVLRKKDAAFYTFDVYIDEAKSNDIPDFVKNCTEIGGLVPVPDITTKPQFPPVAFATTDAPFNANFDQTFDKSCCAAAFSSHALYLDDKYFMKLSPKSVPDIAEQVGVVSITIDGETRNYDVLYHVGTVYLQGQSGQPDEGKSWMYNASATEPPIEPPFDTESLKLKELKFVYVAPWTWATPECKPAIYLYPEEPMEISVKVEPQGRITTSEPEHGEEGWRVVAYPDGTLVDYSSARTLGAFSPGRSQDSTAKVDSSSSCSLRGNLGEPLLDQEGGATKFSIPFEKALSYSCLGPNPRSYSYLYYETELDKVKVPEDGWIVEKEELEDFFVQILPRLGLNETEMKDFMDYWVPKLEGDSITPGVVWFIGLIDRGELDRVEPIEFSMAPDTFIRIRFYFEKLSVGSGKWDVRSENSEVRGFDVLIEEFDPNAEKQKSTLLDQKYPTSHFPPRRIGFTAVDWGAILEKGSCGVDVGSR